MAKCEMYTQEPYPFAWCVTHDETFPLGGICPFHLSGIGDTDE